MMDGEDLKLVRSARKLDKAQIAHRRAAQRFGNRRVPAYPSGGGVRLVHAHQRVGAFPVVLVRHGHCRRSEEHTSELQSLMRISYAVFCLKQKNEHKTINKMH